MKLIMGCLTAAITLVSIGFTVRCLFIYFGMLTGRTPRKPGMKPIHFVIAPLIYLLFAIPGVGAGAVFLSIMFTPPSVIDSEGVSGGGGLVSKRHTIGWDEVERVDCAISRNHSVRQVTVVAGARKVYFSGSFGDLSDVRDAIWAHAPKEAIRPCRIPVGKQHGFLVK
jgi:hypothetical protein